MEHALFAPLLSSLSLHHSSSLNVERGRGKALFSLPQPFPYFWERNALGESGSMCRRGRERGGDSSSPPNIAFLCDLASLIRFEGYPLSQSVVQELQKRGLPGCGRAEAGGGRRTPRPRRLESGGMINNAGKKFFSPFRTYEFTGKGTTCSGEETVAHRVSSEQQLLTGATDLTNKPLCSLAERKTSTVYIDE